MDADAYLMALRGFIARRGTSSELWSDQGTNFKGGERELREAFESMAPTLHSQVLADQFWSRFIREYLPGLQTRQKWHSSPPDLLEKAIVMLVEPQLPWVL